MNIYELNRILEIMLRYKDNVSDLNFSVARPPQVEVSGTLLPVSIKGMEQLSAFQIETLSLAMMDNDREIIRKLVETGSTDLSYSIPGISRFRVNIFMQRGSFSIAMRVIPYGVPSIDEMKLPKVLHSI